MAIINKPIVSEKMTMLGEKLNRYAFQCDHAANKLEIKKAVEEMYNVTVLAVNTFNTKGKKRSRYTRSGVISGLTGTYKKAIVTLKDGDTIDFFSNI